jgi:hypothetical protein
MYRLSNWIILQRTGAVGDTVIRLRGEVSGHARYGDGSQVTISALRTYSQDGDTVTVMTRSGTEYELGTPNSSDPDATARVLAFMRARSEATTVAQQPPTPH